MYKTYTIAKATIHEFAQGEKPSALLVADNASSEDAAAVAKKSEFDPAKDLMKMVSVLVSTGKNRNDDVFLCSELAKVRASGKDKPLNIEHSSDHIIGHMIKTYATKKDGTVIADDVADKSLPEDFDIMNEAVVYAFVKPKVAEAIRKTAAAEELFVSVEMWFSEYDFLVGSKVIRRNQATAFLDSSLKSNGGNGTYKGQAVGRVLRNMLIGGIGVVEKPANPESVIKSISNLRADGVRDVEVYKESAIAKNVVEDLGAELKADEKLTEEQMKELFKEMAEDLKASTADAVKKALQEKPAEKPAEKTAETKASEAVAAPPPTTAGTIPAVSTTVVTPVTSVVSDKVVDELRTALNAAIKRIDALETQGKHLVSKFDEAEQAKAFTARRQALSSLGLKTEDVERRMAKASSMTKDEFDCYVDDIKELFNSYLRGDASTETADDKSAKGGEDQDGEASDTQDADEGKDASDAADAADDSDPVIDMTKLEGEDADLGAATELDSATASVEQRMEDVVVSKLAERNARWRKMIKPEEKKS